MAKPELLLIGKYLNVWEDLANILGICFAHAETPESLASILSNLNSSPTAAFIHMHFYVQENIKGWSNRAIILSHVIETLPLTTRRVLVCNGIEKPNQAKNMAIELQGDLLIDGYEIGKQTLEAIDANQFTPLQAILALAYLSPSEIGERGKSIQLGLGARESISTPPESIQNSYPDSYHDYYYRRSK